MRAADLKPPMAPTSEALQQTAVDRGTSLVTHPEEAVRFIRGLRASVGVRHFVAATAQGGLAHERVLASMSLFAREVADVVRSDVPAPSRAS